MSKIKLDEIAEQFGMLNNESVTVICRSTGEIITISEEYMDYAREEDFDPDSLSDWELEEINLAKEILKDKSDYIYFPDPFEIDNYSIMKRFCESVPNLQQQEALLNSINGSGAFSRFDSLIKQFDIRQEWFKYKDSIYKEMAVEWCKSNNIEYF
jgi:hypothetical protein